MAVDVACGVLSMKCWVFLCVWLSSVNSEPGQRVAVFWAGVGFIGVDAGPVHAEQAAVNA